MIYVFTLTMHNMAMGKQCDNATGLTGTDETTEKCCSNLQTELHIEFQPVQSVTAQHQTAGRHRQRPAGGHRGAFSS